MIDDQLLVHHVLLLAIPAITAIILCGIFLAIIVGVLVEIRDILKAKHSSDQGEGR